MFPSIKSDEQFRTCVGYTILIWGFHYTNFRNTYFMNKGRKTVNIKII